MSKSLDLWLSFSAGIALMMVGYTIESAISYPRLPSHLKDTCQTGNWHPECSAKDVVRMK